LHLWETAIVSGMDVADLGAWLAAAVDDEQDNLSRSLPGP
jgi:hypothetical protein